MKKSVKLGIVCMARKTFDYNAADKIYRDILSEIRKIESVSWTIVKNLVITLEEAKTAGRQLHEAGISGIVCVSGTFHLGHLVLEINKLVQKPILLWGLPE
ncbi:MAG: fucose isomerase, partial [Spirochaetales bacterium]|nr:fucose isomerase [Spirochaetales bacterium]